MFGKKIVQSSSFTKYDINELNRSNYIITETAMIDSLGLTHLEDTLYLKNNREIFVFFDGKDKYCYTTKNYKILVCYFLENDYSIAYVLKDKNWKSDIYELIEHEKFVHNIVNEKLDETLFYKLCLNH